MVKQKEKITSEIKKINGYFKEIVTLFDDSGKPISTVINPLMIELRPRDVAQLFVGAFLVASPLCLTEEVWKISETLPINNFYYLLFASFTTIVMFVYFNFYRDKLLGNIASFVKRIIAIYAISAFSVTLMLFLVDQLPIAENPLVAIKRVVLIGFPSVFGAAVTDYLK